MTRKLLASFFVACFVLVSCVLVFVWSAYSTFLDREFYGEGFSEILYEYSIDELMKVLDLSDFAALSEEDFEIILRKSVAVSDLEEVFSGIIDDLDELNFDGENNTLDVVVPLSWLDEKKSNLVGGLSKYFIENLPECDAGDYFVSDYSCIYPGIGEDDINLQLKSELDRLVFSRLPSDFVFTLRVPASYSGNVGDVVHKIFYYVFVVLFVILLILSACIALIIYKPWVSVCKWLFVPWFLTSLLLVIAFWVFGLQMYIGDLIFANTASEISNPQIFHIKEFYEYASGIFVPKVLFWAFVVGGVSLLLEVFLFIWGRKKIS